MDPGRLLAPLVEAPRKSAILLDVDGTLAPIVRHPELAAVPDETRTELQRLAGRYALVACISGRTGADAARLVGVAGLTYVGVHGLELAPEAERWRSAVQELAAESGWPAENKGLTVAFHFRGAGDETSAAAALERVAERARSAGLVPTWGRKVLEVRPPVDADKGTAVAALLESHRLERALYAGDDTTDIDAFRGLAGARHSVRIAIASEEGPAALREQADLVLASPAELLGVLRLL